LSGTRSRFSPTLTAEHFELLYDDALASGF
jgi:hypothetical protein